MLVLQICVMLNEMVDSDSTDFPKMLSSLVKISLVIKWQLQSEKQRKPSFLWMEYATSFLAHTEALSWHVLLVSDHLRFVSYLMSNHLCLHLAKISNEQPVGKVQSSD